MRNLLFLLLLAPLSLFAQKTFHAGLTAGINGSQIHGDNDWGFHQAGPAGGFFVCTDPSKKWYGQMELLFSRKGSRKLANPDKGDYNSFEFRLNYVEVPFLVRYNTGKIYFELGETIGILAWAREWDTYSEITPLNFRKWETALIVGLGYNLDDHWQVDFRTTNSLFPVYKFPVPAYYPRFIPNLFNRGMYNNLVSLSLCYRFGGGASE